MDEATFDAFYSNCFARLVGQIHAMCGDLTEAQDCVQEAFIRAWDHRRRLMRDQSPEAWVRTTAYRLAVSRWRRSRLDARASDRSLGARTSSARTRRGSPCTGRCWPCRPISGGRSSSTTCAI